MLIAKKPCSFGGEQFFIGDEIPEEMVIDPANQEAIGVLSIVGMEAPEGEAFEGEVKTGQVTLRVPLQNGSEVCEIDLSEENLLHAVKIMQMNAEAAVDEIRSSVEEIAVLAFIHALDHRKTVVKAAEEAAGKMGPPDVAEEACDHMEMEAGDA